MNTLVMTDVATGWTEPVATPYRSQETVLYASNLAASRIPFPLKGLDVDNGTEFINQGMIRFCQENQITLTRSRPYRKIDQCHVEQMNCVVVHRFIGYDFFDGFHAYRSLTNLYRHLRLYINYFQPSMKLIHKHRLDGKVVKVHDHAQTPYRRVMESDALDNREKEVLIALYHTLDPLEFFQIIKAAQDDILSYAYNSADASGLRSNTTPGNTLEACVALGYGSRKEMMSTSRRRSERMFRGAKKSKRYHFVQHTWRTRPDPFEKVNSWIDEELERRPHQGAKTLFTSLQGQFPGQFTDERLRTLQRRVKEWRYKKVMRKSEHLGLVLSPKTEDPVSVQESGFK